MRSARTEFYTAEEYAAAKEVNIAAFLMSIGYELERESRCFKGKIHDSLVIRDDGRWYWNSRDLHGHSPIELYKQILLNDFGYSDEITAAIAAVKQLAGGRGAYIAPVGLWQAQEPPPRSPDKPLLLPAPHKNNNRVMAYLCKTRGLDPEIVRGLMKYGKIYETIQSWNKKKERYENSPYHNAVFVAYDKDGRPQSAFLRGTISMTDKPFKKDVDFSNKSYPFTLSGRQSSNRVFCFESAIDAISHATIFKMCDQDWRDGHRLSLGGTSFLGLDRFLEENPQIQEIVSCLDSDATGSRRSKNLMDEYTGKGFTVIHESPEYKDFNEDLLGIYRDDQEGEMEF
jgi:hypothetical protein